MLNSVIACMHNFPFTNASNVHRVEFPVTCITSLQLTNEHTGK